MPQADIVARADTSIGEFVLRRRTVQSDPGTTFVELLVDGRTLMSDYNTVSERALTRMGISRCRGEELRVLVGGLGLGHTAGVALASPRVAAVDVVELVPEVVDWFARGVIPLAPVLNTDPRLQVIQGDVFARLSGPATATYDLILIDVDHSPDDPLGTQSAAFYTADGLRRARQHLSPDGVLAVWSCRGSREFEATLRDVFSVVETETTLFQDEFFGEPDEINYLFFASETPRTCAPDTASTPA